MKMHRDNKSMISRQRFNLNPCVWKRILCFSYHMPYD